LFKVVSQLGRFSGHQAGSAFTDDVGFVVVKSGHLLLKVSPPPLANLIGLTVIPKALIS
jgi:hypothetical protein